MRVTSLPKTTRAIGFLSLTALGLGFVALPASAVDIQATTPSVSAATTSSATSGTDTVKVTGILQRAIVDAHESTSSGTRTKAPAAQALRPATLGHEDIALGIQVGKSILPVEDPNGELATVDTGKTVTLNLDANAPELEKIGVDTSTPLTTADVQALASSSVDTLTVASVVKTTKTAAAVTPRTHDTYVAMIVPTDAPGILPTEAQTRSTINASSQYWNSQTFGAVSSLQVKAVKQVPVNLTAAQLCYYNSPFDIFEIGQLAFPTVDATSAHIINVLPTCAHNIAGVATIGAGVSSGGHVLLHSVQPDILIHELGHNFSLGHSNLEISEERTYYPYMGLHSPMAGGTYSAISPALDVAFQKELGVLPQGHITTVSNSGSVTLAPASNASGARAATFVDPVDKRTYYIEYRSGTGRDLGADYLTSDVFNEDLTLNARFSAGVRIYTVRYDDFDTPEVNTIGMRSTGLIDSYGYPYTHLGALKTGETGSSVSGGFKVTVTGATATSATVKIELKKAGTSIAASAAKSTYGTSAVIPVNFASTGTTGGTIEAWSGTTKIGSIKVPGGSGTRALKVPVLKTLSVKSHPVTLKFLGSATHAAASTNTTVTVSRAATSQTVSLSNLYYKQAGKVSLVVKSAIAPSGTASVYVDGKLISKAKVTNGKASFTLPSSLKLGKHTLRVNFAQTGTHNASVVSKAFTVVKKKATISGLATGTKKVKTGKTYKDEFTVNHTALLQKKSGTKWKTIKTIPAGKYTLSHKAGKVGSSATYRVVIKSTSAVTGVTSKTIVVKSVR